MRRFCLLFVLLVLAASRVPSLAQTASTLSPLPPENFQIAGTWNCEGSFRGGQVHKSVYSGAVVLDGKWLQLEEKDIQPATHYVAEYLIGYDSQQQRLVEFDANNFGAAVYASDEGWRNNSLTMTSPLSQDAKAPYVANRFVFSIQAPDGFTVDWQIARSAALEWIPSDHLVCRRSANG